MLSTFNIQITFTIGLPSTYHIFVDTLTKNCPAIWFPMACIIGMTHGEMMAIHAADGVDSDILVIYFLSSKHMNHMEYNH